MDGISARHVQRSSIKATPPSPLKTSLGSEPSLLDLFILGPYSRRSLGIGSPLVALTPLLSSFQSNKISASCFDHRKVSYQLPHDVSRADLVKIEGEVRVPSMIAHHLPNSSLSARRYVTWPSTSDYRGLYCPLSLLRQG